MTIASILLDIGNILFFVGTLPQLVKTYKNRHNLKETDLSISTFFIYNIAYICFICASIFLGAYFTTILLSGNIIFNFLIIYWILESRKVKEKKIEVFELTNGIIKAFDDVIKEYI